MPTLNVDANLLLGQLSPENYTKMKEFRQGRRGWLGVGGGGGGG